MIRPVSRLVSSLVLVALLGTAAGAPAMARVARDVTSTGVLAGRPAVAAHTGLDDHGHARAGHRLLLWWAGDEYQPVVGLIHVASRNGPLPGQHGDRRAPGHYGEGLVHRGMAVTEPVPHALPGAYTITAYGTQSGATFTGAVNIVPVLEPGTTLGAAGVPFSLSGNGFLPGGSCP